MLGALNNSRMGLSSSWVPDWDMISGMLETGTTWIMRGRKHIHARSHGQYRPRHSWKVRLLFGNESAACCAVSAAIHIRQAFCSCMLFCRSQRCSNLEELKKVFLDQSVRFLDRLIWILVPRFPLSSFPGFSSLLLSQILFAPVWQFSPLAWFLDELELPVRDSRD